MRLPRINYEPQYRDMNVGAHRKPIQNAGAPGLVWHLGFWRPDSERGPDLSGSSDDHWHMKIDQFLSYLYLRSRDYFSDGFTCLNDTSGIVSLFRSQLDACSRAPNWRDAKPLLTPISAEMQLQRHEYLTLSGKIEGATLSVRAGLHHEYWTLTFILDLSKFGAGLHRPDRRLAPFINGFDELGRFVEQKYQAGLSDPDLVQKTANLSQSPQARAANSLVNGFRQLILKDFLTPCKEFLNQNCLIEDKDGNIVSDANRPEWYLGGTFADFTGNIFGVLPANSKNETSTRDLSITRAGAEYTPERSIRTKTIMRRLKSRTFRNNEVHEIVNAFWPTVKVLQEFTLPVNRNGLRRASGGEKREYTVSSLQDDRAIYISSLGRMFPTTITPVDSDSLDCEPVIYTLVVGYGSRWPLGRLIHRINQFGTLRLAAVRDLQKLTIYSDKLRLIEHDLANPSYDAVANAGNLAFRFRTIQAVGDDGNPNFDPVASQAPPIVPNGVMYRVDRSRYYVQLFRDWLQYHRVERVEGFQKYDDFVLSRLGDVYEFIDRLGKRYAEARQDIELALRTSQARASVSQQRETNILLRVAEWATIVPTSAYAMHLIEEPLKDYFYSWAISLLGISAGFLVYLGLRWVERDIRDRGKDSGQ